MSVKLLFSVSTQNLAAARWQGRKLIDCGVFLNDASGWQEFSRFLADFSGRPAYILVNAVEEDYRSEALPHTWGPARATLLARKLAQMFRNTPYRAAVLQGQETRRRREDIFLFSALSNADLLRPWVERLNANSIPVAGVYLLPMVSEALLTALSLNDVNVLLVSEHTTGLRQSYFRHGKLKASRLSFADHSHKNNQADYAAEIDRTLLYLHSMKALNPDDALAIAILDPTDKLAALCQHYGDEGDLRCIHVDRAYIEKKINDARNNALSSSDLVHLYVLSRRRNLVNLAPPVVTQNFGTYQARRVIYGLSALVLVIAAAWSALNLIRYNNYEKRAFAAAQATQLSAARYREAALRFPAAPASAAELQSAVQIAQRMTANQPTPERLMQIASNGLQAYPQIELQGLRWKPGPPEAGLLEGEIKPFRGDYRAAIADVTSFTLALKGMAEVASVQVLEWPLNLSSAEGMSGSTQDEEKTGDIKAKFKLKIELRPSGENK